MNEDKATRYHRLRRRADLLATLAAGLLLLLLAVTGAAIRLREGVQAVAAAFLPSGLDEAATVVLIALIVLGLLHAVELPFAWYQGFVLEHRYGLSTARPSRWLADHGKALGVGTVLGVGGSVVVFATLRAWPSAWWLISAGVFGVAMLGLARLAPVLLLPLFYRVRPLDRPPLVERLMRLAARARTDVVGVFEWVLSDHTRKANAALAGLGRTRRILLSDTLLADYSEDEIEVVLAHELAHHVHHDLWRAIGIQLAMVVAGFYVAHVVLGRAVVPLGYRGASDPAGLPLLLLLAGAWSLIMLPVANAASRAQERAADRYALEATGNPDAFVSAMKRLSQQNLAEDQPPPLIRVLFHSHPTIRERIAAARAFTRT